MTMKWKQLNDRTKAALAIIPAILAVAGWLVAFGATSAQGAMGERVDSLEVTAVRRMDSTDARLKKVEAMADTVSLTWCVVRAGALGEDAQRNCLFGDGRR